MDLRLKSSKILFYFDNLIKSGDIFLLRVIQNKYYDQYKDYINIDWYKAINDEDLLYFYCARDVINPLEWLKKKDFDFETNYKYLKAKYKNMYISSPFMDIIKSFDKYNSAYFIEQILLYSEEYDKRIDFEIAANFPSDKYVYVTGPLSDVIDQLKPEVIFYPYVNEFILGLSREHPEIVFIFPEYGFNLDEDNLPKGYTNEDLNLATYPVLRRKDKKYFG